MTESYVLAVSVNQSCTLEKLYALYHFSCSLPSACLYWPFCLLVISLGHLLIAQHRRSHVKGISRYFLWSSLGRPLVRWHLAQLLVEPQYHSRLSFSSNIQSQQIHFQRVCPSALNTSDVIFNFTPSYSSLPCLSIQGALFIKCLFIHQFIPQFILQ